MANRYWVTGGTGNWNSTTNWSTASGGASGASVPGSSDAALFDASSGSGTATLDISPTVQTLTCTGFTGTLAFGTNTISLNSTGTVFTGVLTMTVTGTPLIILINNSATARTITPTAVTEANSISFRITAGTGTLTTTAGSYRDLDFTNGTNPTGYAGALQGGIITVYGNFKASTGMTQASVTNTITFAATSGTKTITTAAVVFDRPFTFNGVGGSWQLQDALTSGATRTCSLTNGTLDLNGYTLTTGLFSSGNSNIRTLAFSTGNITVTGSGATVFTISDSTNLTVTGTSAVNLTYSGSTGTRQINASLTNASANTALNYNISAGSDTVTFGTSDRSVNNVNFTGFSGIISDLTKTFYGNLTLASTNISVASSAAVKFVATSGTKTITTASKTLDFPVTFNGIGGTWAMQDALTLGSAQTLTMTNGTLQLAASTTNTVGSFVTTGTTLKYLQSTTPGTRSTISQASGTVTATYLSVQDSNATGGATWNAFVTDNNVNAGNNTGWDFFAQIGRYIYSRRKNRVIFN
jgi:hypothetical protein